MRAFRRFALPVGGYQFIKLHSENYPEGCNNPPGDRTIHLSAVSQNLDGTLTGFETHRIELYGMSEEAQRHLIQLLQANLDDNLDAVEYMAMEIPYAKLERDEQEESFYKE
jgi:hypothetical protein